MRSNIRLRRGITAIIVVVTVALLPAVPSYGQARPSAPASTTQAKPTPSECTAVRRQARQLATQGRRLVVCHESSAPADASAGTARPATPSKKQASVDSLSSSVDLVDWCALAPGQWWVYRYEACIRRNAERWLVFDAQTDELIGDVVFAVTHYSWTNYGSTMYAEMVTVSRQSYWGWGVDTWYDLDLSCTGSCSVQSSDWGGVTPADVTATGIWYLISDISGSEEVALGYNVATMTVGIEDHALDSYTWFDAPYVRCDSINRSNTAAGCVFPMFTPTVTWWTNGPYSEVAQHIRDAQALGLPGRPGTRPLNRLQNAALQTLNRSVACPSTFETGLNESCDEYPFASTWQGAYTGGGPYSARPVNETQNEQHGFDLWAFYQSERVIDPDPFWVDIDPYVWFYAPAGGNSGGGSSAPSGAVVNDYDHDGYSDLALYRRNCTTGSTWWVKSVHTGQQLVGGLGYGGCTDIPARGDYDRDGYADLGLYRRDCTTGSTWWAKSVHTNQQLLGGFGYGGCTDIPAPGDYDGDGQTDLALYRQDCTNGSTWWVRSSRTGQQPLGGLRYGGCTDIPAPGDYDGDGYTDLALYRRDCANGSTWWVRSGRTGQQLAGGLGYGGCTDIPAAGDYDGDGYTDLALYRRNCSTGSTWWVKSLHTGQQIYGGLGYGGCGDIPAPGDYDSDDYTDLALYRQNCSTGSTWWIRSARTNQQIYGGLAYGGCADVPVAQVS